MAKDRLMIVEDHHGNLQIQWWIAEIGDMGAVLGEDCNHARLCQWDKALERNEIPGDDLDHCAATVAAWKYKATEIYSGASVDSGFYWTTRRDAQQALQLAKLAIREAQAGVPYPEWAKMAIANGWKAPKGWKPRAGDIATAKVVKVPKKT